MTKTVVIDENILYRAAEIENEEGRSCLRILLNILDKCHRLAVSNKILRIYGQVIGSLSKKPSAQYVVRLLIMILHSGKIVEKSPVKVNETLSIGDERDREFITVALSSEKIMVSMDADLKRQVEDIGLKRYELEVISPRDAEHKLNF